MAPASLHVLYVPPNAGFHNYDTENFHPCCSQFDQSNPIPIETRKSENTFDWILYVVEDDEVRGVVVAYDALDFCDILIGSRDMNY